FERFKGLYEGKAVSEQEFDEMKTKKRLAVLRYEQALQELGRAKAMLGEAESFLGYTVIRSPFRGVVAEKNIDIGSMTTPGMPLFIVEGGGYLVETPVSEGMINRIEEGKTVELTIDSLGIKTTGRVTTLVRQVDPATRTFMVKVQPVNRSNGFRGGLFVRVGFPLKERALLLVPNKSIVKRGQMRGIYVVDDKGVINLRFVRTGKEVDGRVEILSGLNEGERIVVSGTAMAVDGGRIAQ
ncbi:Membrane fusion protein of RND family multidrug efflux pump, partial [hydrothermal vent metagenome]